jgi:hypothetical protein
VCNFEQTTTIQIVYFAARRIDFLLSQIIWAQSSAGGCAFFV